MSKIKIEKIEKKPSVFKRYQAKIFSLAPAVGLVLVCLFYVWAMSYSGLEISPLRLGVLLKNIITTAIVSIGAVYAFAGGAIDMSMSGSVCCTAVIAALVAKTTGSVPLTLVTCMVVAIVLGLLKGALACYMQVPAFIVTIVLGTIMSAFAATLMGEETTISLAQYFPIETEQTIKVGIIILLVFYVVALIAFNYTKIGKSIKLLGGNPRSATQSGLQANKYMFIAFIVGGFAIGLAAIFTMMDAKSVAQGTGSALGNDMMVAVVLGGMPLSGGSKSRISAAIIGAATITILNTSLMTMGFDQGSIQIVRGILFLVVVFVTSMSYRGKLLPR